MNITIPQFADTQQHVDQDAADRQFYLESAFTRVIVDLQSDISGLQGKLLLGDMRVQEKILKKEERKKGLILKKQERLQLLELSKQISPISFGCVYYCSNRTQNKTALSYPIAFLALIEGSLKTDSFKMSINSFGILNHKSTKP